ncbi:MAG TPA: hypothetical protein VGL22_00010 [Terracidiphilus sp.]
MKFSFARLGHAAVVTACLACVLSPAQTTTPPTPPARQNPPRDKGKVVFSRSTDENGNTSSTAGPAAQQAPETAARPTAQDAERTAITFTSFDMDVHLRPAEHQLAVRAIMTVRNDGKVPLAHLPLQISSSLNWERILVNSKDALYQVALLNSDADHTGRLREAGISLAVPLAPGATLSVDATYSGVIEKSAQRLLSIGTPDDVALHSDWDEIGTAFTGLRGFGNVLWYPVSSVPVMLGDGAKLFDEMGEHKLRMAGARFRLRLTTEFPHQQAPTVAVINGHPAALAVVDAGTPEVAGVATAESEPATLGFEAPSLFVAQRTSHPGQNLTAWTTADNQVNAQLWNQAAQRVTPFLQGWLGQKPRAQLTLLDLPEREDAPFEAGALLATNLRDALPDQLDGILAHALTHAWMQSPRAWLSEGVAHFMGTLWVEKQQGRDKALTALASGRDALAIAEPASPGAGPGQPLAASISPVYYRTKAGYVLWMLRDIAGDAALSAALRAYDPQKDLGAEGYFESLVEQAGTRHDLKWFFADWVDADKGLPDLTVDKVYPTVQGSSTVVAITISNSGYAAAEVPVSVRTTENSITQRVRIPEHGSVVQRIVIQGQPIEVQVNDGTIPETEASEHITPIGPPNPATPATRFP